MKFKCNPTVSPCSSASSAARFESSINTMALTDEMVPLSLHSRIRCRLETIAAPIIGVYDQSATQFPATTSHGPGLTRSPQY